MRFKPTRIVASIAVIGAVAAGGAAFTDSNTGQAGTTAGYSSASVTGGTIDSLSYTTYGDGYLDTATIVTDGWTENGSTGNSAVDATITFSDTNGDTIYEPVACNDGTEDGNNNTEYVCDIPDNDVSITSVEHAAITLLSAPVSGT